MKFCVSSECKENFMKIALITGITGHDGAYLAKHLLNLNYKVYGAFRRSASPNRYRLNELGIANEVEFVPIELLEYSNIQRIIEAIKPDEIYNLAAQSFVAASFDQPLYTSDVDGLGVMRFLEVIRTVNPNIRFYQASSSEMFGKVQAIPQTETTPFYPRSPYGVAKVFAHFATVNYRESYNLHASCGILFNHESPLRGLEFVTRKITDGLAKIKAGLLDYLELGNLEAKRDWGFAGDYVEAMHLMLQQNKADDYVIATGENHSVKEFIEIATHCLKIPLRWQGTQENTIGIDNKTGKTIIKINPKFYRPAEVDTLLGDATKAKKNLKWVPKISFQQLVEMMAEADMKRQVRKHEALYD